MFETLERRRLLSTTVTNGLVTLTSCSTGTVTLNEGRLVVIATSFVTVKSDGTLIVNGTDNPDTIGVVVKDAKVVVTRTTSGVTTTEGFRASRVKRIRIEARTADTGEDRIQ